MEEILRSADRNIMTTVIVGIVLLMGGTILFLANWCIKLRDRNTEKFQDEIKQQIKDLAVRKLTPAENEVFELRTMGLTRDEIAEKRFRSPETIKKQIQSIDEKLNLARAQKIVIYMKETGKN